MTQPPLSRQIQKLERAVGPNCSCGTTGESRSPCSASCAGRAPLLELGRDVTAADVAAEPVIMHSPTEARYFHDLVVGAVPIAPENVVRSVSQVLTMLWRSCICRGGNR